jgi:F-type H+-transporting ATPase subunit epsilon
MADQHSSAHGGSSGRMMQCSVVTPEATVLEAAAKFVAMPLYDGEIGIAPAHSPFIGRLGYGELRVEGAGATKRYYVDGGFVQVADDLVSILTQRAIPAEQLNASAAIAALEAARAKPANSPELLALREKAEMQARAQLRMARRLEQQ